MTIIANNTLAVFIISAEHHSKDSAHKRNEKPVGIPQQAQPSSLSLLCKFNKLFSYTKTNL